MPRRHYRHDVYDDTERGQEGRETERHPVPVIRRRHGSQSSRSGELVDPFQDMNGAMRRFQEDVDRTLGAGFGFGSMFGEHGLMTSFDRMFDEAASGFTGAVANAHGGSGTYFYESKTRTVGPDGRVHEEHVRTTPDEYGNPQTKRTVRDGDSVRETNPMDEEAFLPFGRPHGMIRDPRREPEVIVEEVDDDDTSRSERNSRRRARRHDGDVEVEEITEPHPQSTRDWMRERYRQWRHRR